MRTIKFVSSIVLMVSVVSILAACGGKSQGSMAGTPAAVAVTPLDGQVNIAWATNSSATYYNIYYSTTSGVTTTTGTKIPAVNPPYIVNGLTNGMTYYFLVTSVSSPGESGPTLQVSATPLLSPPPTVVSATARVTATAGEFEAIISWPAVSGATSYNIYWSSTAGVTPTNGTKVTGVTSPYVMAGLTNGTTYYFVVTAVNASGVESAASSQVSASIAPSTGPYITATVLSMAAGGTPPWGWLQQVGVYTDSSQQAPITNAGVTVNGTSLTYNASDQHYEGNVSIATGAGITVDVTINSLTYSVSGTQYSTAPGIVAPVSGLQHTNDNTITWTPGAPINNNLTTWNPGTPIGSSYFIGVMDSSGNFDYPANSGNGGTLGILEIPVTSASPTIPGACSWTIPANSITTAGTYTVYVALGTSGLADNAPVTIPIPIPNTSPEAFLPESGLWIGLISTVPVTVQ